MNDTKAVIAQGLTKRFGDFTAVNNIDFEVQPRRDIRLSRSEWIGQNDNHPHDAGIDETDFGFH